MLNRLHRENEVEALGPVWHQLHGTPDRRGARRKVLQRLVTCVESEAVDVRIRLAHDPQVSSLPATDVKDPSSRLDRVKNCLGPANGSVRSLFLADPRQRAGGNVSSFKIN